MADRILVTGTNGFVGSALCPRLRDSGFLVRGAIRNLEKSPTSESAGIQHLEYVTLHDRSDEKETGAALADVKAVVHLAARVHVMKDQSSDPLREFRRINCSWTERLARTASTRGVKRFVYLSSVKVNGERTVKPFHEEDLPAPEDPYGVSKWEAEQALARISNQMGMEIVIVRSPLVYGPGVRGNFLQLLKVIRRGIPLPLGLVENHRSLIYRGNLVDALTRCVTDQRAAGRTYLVSDGEDLSTPELIRRLGRAMDKSTHLWPVPVSLLRFLGRLVNQSGAIERLTGSLQVDISMIRRELEWCPPFSIECGLAETVDWFLRPSAT